MPEKLPLLKKKMLYGKDESVGIPSWVFDRFPHAIGIYVAIMVMDSWHKPRYPDLYHINQHELWKLGYVSKEVTKGRMYQIHPDKFPRVPMHDILEVLNGEVVFKKSFPLYKFIEID